MTEFHMPLNATTATTAAKAVLAGCMIDQNFAERAIETLTPDDFLDGPDLGELYSPIFAAITSLVSKGKRSVPAMIAREMDKLNIKPEWSYDTATYLGEIMRAHTPGVNPDEYAKIVAEFGYRRRLRLSGMKQIDLSNNMELAVEDLAAEHEKIHTEVTSKTISDEKPIRLGEVIRQQLEIQRNRKKGAVIGVKTWFSAVDAILMGLQPGDFVVIAARPSMGKTAFAEEVAANVAKHGGSAAVASLEMSNEQLAMRSIASEGGVSGELMKAGMVDERHWTSVYEQLERSGILDARLFVNSNVGTIQQIRQWAHRIKREHGLDILFIDYLQLAKPSERYRGNRVQEVGEISHALKALAKELGIPVVALSQLSRAVEQREDKRPMLSDLRETGDIEQDSDIVAFIYRDDYYAERENRPSSAQGQAEVIIAKHRNGPIGTANLAFIKERTKFTDLELRRV